MNIPTHSPRQRVEAPAFNRPPNAPHSTTSGRPTIGDATGQARLTVQEADLSKLRRTHFNLGDKLSNMSWTPQHLARLVDEGRLVDIPGRSPISGDPGFAQALTKLVGGDADSMLELLKNVRPPRAAAIKFCNSITLRLGDEKAQYAAFKTLLDATTQRGHESFHGALWRELTGAALDFAKVRKHFASRVICDLALEKNPVVCSELDRTAGWPALLLSALLRENGDFWHAEALRERTSLVGAPVAPYVQSCLGDGAEIRWLLKFQLDPNMSTANGDTLLVNAFKNNDDLTAASLIKHGANKMEADEEGTVPLMNAASRNMPATLDMLIRKGAKLGVKDDQGRTALMHAALNGRAGAVARLLASAPLLGADLDKQGRNAMSHAAMNGHAGTVEALLGSGSRPVLQLCGRDADARIALMHAAMNGHVETVEALLKNNSSARAQLQLQDKGGFTALMHAASKGHVQVVKCLVERGSPLPRPEFVQSLLGRRISADDRKQIEHLLTASRDLPVV